MRLRNTEHLQLSTKMDSKCTHKKAGLHVFWMLRVIYKKTEPNRRFFQNRTETETEPNLKNPFRTSLLYSVNYCFTSHCVCLAGCLHLPSPASAADISWVSGVFMISQGGLQPTPPFPLPLSPFPPYLPPSSPPAPYPSPTPSGVWGGAPAKIEFGAF